MLQASAAPAPALHAHTLAAAGLRALSHLGASTSSPPANRESVWGEGEPGPRASLEMPVRVSSDRVSALLSTGAFGATVETDLPSYSSRLFGFPSTEGGGGGLPKVVTTVACRWGVTPTITDIRARLASVASSGARAALLAGGDQDTWRNPNPSRPDVFALMEFYQEACHVAKEGGGGAVPAMWCVANPLAADAAAEARRLALKKQAGAVLCVVQPPAFLPDRAARFWREAALGDGEGAMPVLASVMVPGTTRSLARRLAGCGVDVGDAAGVMEGGVRDYASKTAGPDPEVAALLSEWRGQEEAGRRGDADAWRGFRMGQLRAAVDGARNLPGCVGVHLCPVDGAGVDDLTAFLRLRRAEAAAGEPLL